jgi:small GTP-binding protein
MNNNESISIMIIGQPNVGKTSYYFQLAQNKFYEEHIETLGVDFFYTNFSIKNKNYKINFYDASGSEMFEKMVSSMYSKMDAIIIMYDVTNLDSFHYIPIWHDRIKSQVYDDIPVFLLGNKIDLLNKPKSNTSQKIIDKYIKMCDLELIEISVKENKNVEKSFEKIINKIVGNKKDKICIVM